jgi:competence protein ComEC
VDLMMAWLRGAWDQVAQASQRRPAVAAAGGLVLGILCHGILPLWPATWLASAAVLASLTIAVNGRTSLAPAPLAVAIFLLGLAGAQIQAFCYAHDHVGFLVGDEPHLAELEIEIHQEPRLLVGPPAASRPLPPRQVTQASVLRIRTGEGWRDASGVTLVHVDQPHPRLAIRQRLRAVGLLQRPRSASNPGEFDWAAYYRDQRILTAFTIPLAANITILDEGSPTWLDGLRRGARETLEAGFDQTRHLDHLLLRALLLGDSDPQLRDVQEDFLRTGTSHHLAISGMHIAILGGFVFGVCRLLRLSPQASAWIVLAFVVLYGSVALPSPPVVRSVILCLLLGLGVLARRTVDPVQLLAAAAAIMLLWQPLDLYRAGFQLSFVTVLGLMLLGRPMLDLLSRRKTGDEALLDSVVLPPAWYRTVGATLKGWALAALAAGLVAWLVSAPLIASHFSQLNPYAMPASIVLGVPVLLSLLGGLLKIVLTLLLPSLAGTWAGLASAPVALMRDGVDLLARLPGSDVPMPAPPAWAVALFYLLLLGPILPVDSPWPRLRSLLRKGPLAAAAMVVLLPLLLGLLGRGAATNEARITLLSVGAGQCAVIQMPSGQCAILDAGSTSAADVDRRIIVPFLRHCRLTRVDTLVLSHADADHTNAAVGLAEACGIERIAATAWIDRDSPSLLAALDGLGQGVSRLTAGQNLPLGDGVQAQVLWPPASLPSAARRNDHSLVLRLSIGPRTILFTGDIVDAAQRQLLLRPELLKADVLVAPHHGGCEPGTEAFLAAVDPRIVICSSRAAINSRQKQFDRLCAGRWLYRTGDCGAATVRIDGSGQIDVQTYRKSKTAPGVVK